MTRSVFYGVVIISLILIAFSYYNYLWVHKKHTGNAKMRKFFNIYVLIIFYKSPDQ